MARQFAYRVCQVQGARVTFVNGKWQGQGSPAAAEDPEAALATCPTEWEYLRRAGAAGWELVGAATAGSGDLTYRVLYLKRARK
jgi:hypothetical protein